MTGHLFVVHGDLRTFACDAVVIPCDDRGAVSDVWRELVTTDRPQDHRKVHLLDTVGGVDSIEELADRAVGAVDHAARNTVPHEGREQPLVGLPLVGTGGGGRARQRGAVIQRLVERLQDALAFASFDVAVVTHDADAFAALQSVRDRTQPKPVPGSAGEELLGAIFRPPPHQWGLRGDVWLWEAMRERLEGVPVPPDAQLSRTLLIQTFQELVGVDPMQAELPEDQRQVYRPELAHGGMSSGVVDVATWRDRLIPLLARRAAALVDGGP